MFAKNSATPLNGGEYDIGWDYDWDDDVCSLKFIFIILNPSLYRLMAEAIFKVRMEGSFLNLINRRQ